MPLIRGRYAVTNPAWLADGKPAAFCKSNLRRDQLVTNGATLTAGVMTSTAMYFDAGDLVTSLTFLSGGTALGTPTNWWFGLYDDSATPVLMSQSADQLTAAWAANTPKTLALAVAQSIPRAGVYYAAVNCAGATAPTLAGVTLENAAAAGVVVTGQKILAITSGTSLTTTAPATITGGTTVATIPYCVAT